MTEIIKLIMRTEQAINFEVELSQNFATGGMELSLILFYICICATGFVANVALICVIIGNN